MGIGTAEGALEEMMVVPSGYGRDSLLADWTEAVLFFPEA